MGRPKTTTNPEMETSAMQPLIPTPGIPYECVESRRYPGEWHVEAIDHVHEGIIYAATFSGQLAEERAKEYAAWKNASGRPQ